MPVKVLIPSPLRIYAENNDLFFAEASTVGDALRQLTSQYSQVRKHLYSEDGSLGKFVNVYAKRDDIRFLQGGRTAISEGDVISIIPSIAGG